jgi:hypothetical protein
MDKKDVQIFCLSTTQKRYADRIDKYHAITTKPIEEVRTFLTREFRVGTEWYSNKLEQLTPLSDGSGYAFTIRDPYKD